MKDLKKYLIILLLLLYGGCVYAQPTSIDPMLIHLKARLINIADSSAVPYATIINNRTHSGISSDANGYFSMEMLNIDTLIVTSIGYRKTKITPPRNYYNQEVVIYEMEPLNIGLSEVKVEGKQRKIDLGLGNKKPVDIDPYLRGSAFNTKPTLLNAIFNPLSYWHYYLSSTEKEKRAVREAMLLEKYWEMHSKNYNKEMVKKLTGLEGAEADTFMVWFNEQNVLPYTSTEYQVRASIIQYFNIYENLKEK